MASITEQRRVERLELRTRFIVAYQRLLRYDKVVIAELLDIEWRRLETDELVGGYVRIGRRELTWAAEKLAQVAADESGSRGPG